MTIRYLSKDGHMKIVNVEWAEVVDWGTCRASKEMFRFDEEKECKDYCELDL